MIIHLAADHTGFTLKETLATFLTDEGHTVVDHGASTYNGEDDYPEYVIPCAQAVKADAGSLGIVIGGSGHGEAMAANRTPGIRAATFYGPRKAIAALEATGESGEDMYDIVRVSRMHNDANILSLGARFVTHEEAHEAVRVFITTAFSGDERHVRRIGQF